MLSLIFAAMWLLSVKKCQHVTIDGVYILLPVLADSYILTELFKCLTH